MNLNIIWHKILSKPVFMLMIFFTEPTLLKSYLKSRLKSPKAYQTELCNSHSGIQLYKPLNDEKDSITSALGITWDQSSDWFMFRFKPEDDENSRPIKLNILSIAASLFDSMGLLSPLIIVSKIMVQELWLLKLQWDELLPQNLHTAWQNLLVDMQSLPTINIPRFCLNEVTTIIEVHEFCDSSIRPLNLY